MVNLKLKKQSIFFVETNVRLIIYDTLTKKTEIVDCGSNDIVNSGKQSIIDRILQVGNTNEGIITYGAVGTGTTAVDATQTTLVTELARRVIVSGSSRRTNQTGTLRTFFDVGVATGTLKEFAWFGGGVNGDAGAGADSGTMYNRILIDRTITATQSLTVEQSITAT
jgi:hypothetical protein